MVSDMLRQTRNALIYADLAFFLIDTRQGINYNDVALYRWLTKQNELKALQKSKPSKKSLKKQQEAEVTVEGDDTNYFQKIIEEEKANK